MFHFLKSDMKTHSAMTREGDEERKLVNAFLRYASLGN